MFRCRQKFSPSGTHAILVVSDRILENGMVERVISEAGSMELPPPENFDLGLMIKAGVNLKRVNCKLITNSSGVLPEEVVNPETEKTVTVNKEN